MSNDTKTERTPLHQIEGYTGDDFLSVLNSRIGRGNGREFSTVRAMAGHYELQERNLSSMLRGSKSIGKNVARRLGFAAVKSTRYIPIKVLEEAGYSVDEDGNIS